MLGMPVVYHVPESHHTETVIGDSTVAGSVHHRELRDFAAQVTREHPDGAYDLVIFPPGELPKHIERVAPGNASGMFSMIELPRDA
jgi:hypothetical protein